MPKKPPTLAARFARIRMPQATIILGLIAAFVYLATALPEDRWGMVARIVGGLLTLLGVGGTLGQSLLRTPEEAEAVSTPPPPPPPSRRAGFAEIDALLLLLFAAVLAVSAFVHGCGGAPRAGRVALEATATALVVVDEGYALHYTAKAAEALEQSTTAAEYASRMQPLDAVEDALRAVRSTLFVAEQLLDAWDAGGAARWPAAAACVAGALDHLADVMRIGEVEIPPVLVSALALVGGFAGACPSTSSSGSAAPPLLLGGA